MEDSIHASLPFITGEYQREGLCFFPWASKGPREKKKFINSLTCLIYHTYLLEACHLEYKCLAIYKWPIG
jgi:hypothetical protein